ncbi:hypothetical protein SCHPADRAFT_676488 [Schizopora paradoxa]|uniref:Pre-rRNA-processing protein TSR2 n=1 Tax=Schizopora paradoxa TaxID=27342 RepID=A0A0H2R663_9AGAM|nr:hypothetical protein SCHPADRAFT_676488 [Schizopora paradoxa]
MSDSSTTSPDPTLVLFARGIIARLNTWPVLSLAVDNSWGGPDSADKRTWIASVVVDSFDPSQNPETPDDVYVEEQLLQIMSDEFDTEIEDGSAEGVAKDIVKLWSQLGSGAIAAQMVEEWEAAAKKAKGKPIPVEIKDETNEEEGDEDEDDSMDGEEEEEAAPSLLPPKEKTREGPEVDEDGFTLVKKSGRTQR